LAREGSDLSRQDAVLRQANANFINNALPIRSGNASLNQELNNNFRMNQTSLDHTNVLIDQNLDRVTISSVRQVSDRTFYLKNGRWVDSQLVAREPTAQPSREVQFGTVEYFDLAERLAKQGRQGSLALGGDILIDVDGRSILVRGSASQSSVQRKETGYEAK
jgi:hypothetical protein